MIPRRRTNAAKCTVCRRNLELQLKPAAASLVLLQQALPLLVLVPLQLQAPPSAKLPSLPGSPSSRLSHPSLEKPQRGRQDGKPPEPVVLPARSSLPLKNAAVRTVWPVALSTNLLRRPASELVIPARHSPMTARAAPSKDSKHSAGRQPLSSETRERLSPVAG